MTRIQIIGNALSEFAPIGTFLVVTEWKGFDEGLEMLILVSLITLFLSWIIERRIPKFGIFAASIIIAFGTLSIVLDDPFYIIIKDTLYYAAFSLALLIGILLGRSPFKTFFGDFFAMSEDGWKTLSLRWALFFLLLTAGNELARHFLTADGWVRYKLIALLGMWAFGLYQFTLIRRERLPEASKWGFRVGNELRTD